MAAAGAEVLIRTVAWGCAAVGVLALTGCGGTVGARSSRISSASARAADEGSSRFEITYDFPRMADAAKVPTLTGEMSYVTGVGELRYEFGGKVFQEIVFDGKRTYMRMSSLAKYLGTTKEWVRVDNGDDEPSIDVVSFVGGPAQVRDPSKVLEFLLGTSGEIDEVGSDAVRGVPTTHYRGAIDMERVIERAPADQRADLRDELEALSEDGFPKTIPFDIWIDDDGLARRVRLELASGDTGGSETIEFYDFGVAVDVQPPAPSEVLTDEEFAKLMEQHQGESQDCDDSKDADTKPSTSGESGVVDLCVVATGEEQAEGDK